MCIAILQSKLMSWQKAISFSILSCACVSAQVCRHMYSRHCQSRRWLGAHTKGCESPDVSAKNLTWVH